jgi:hypothetical protein
MSSKKKASPIQRFIMEVGAQHMTPWETPVGKLMLNFGGLELLSHLYVQHLARDPAMTWLATDMPFSKRLDLIIGLVDREDLPKSAKERMRNSWKKVKQHNRIRNTIAHNPLMWGWSGKQEGPPDFIGVPDIKKASRKKSRPTVLKELLVDLKKLKTLVKELRDTNIALYEELKGLQESVDTRD